VGRLMTCLCWKSDARPRSPPLPNEGTGDPARRQRRGHLFSGSLTLSEGSAPGRTKSDPQIKKMPADIPRCFF